MTQAKLTQLKMVNEYGDPLPQAQVLFLDVCLNINDGMKVEEEGEEYKEYSSVGGCYKVIYYGNPLTKAQGYAPRRLRTFIDGVYDDILYIDESNPEISDIDGNSELNAREKRLQIAQSDFEYRFK